MEYPQQPERPPYPQPGYQPSQGFNETQYAQYPGRDPAIIVQPYQVQPVYLAKTRYMNFTGAIILSCLVYWCCGALFGLIAFILAMVGQSAELNGEDARSLLISSYVLSAVGCVIGIIVIIVLCVFIYSYSYKSYNG